MYGWAFMLGVDTFTMWSLTFPVYLFFRFTCSFLYSLFSNLSFFPLVMSTLRSLIVSPVGARGIMGSTCHTPTCFSFMTWFPRENNYDTHPQSHTTPSSHVHIHSPSSLIPYPLVTHTHSCPCPLHPLCLHTYTHPISFQHQTIWGTICL